MYNKISTSLANMLNRKNIRFQWNKAHVRYRCADEEIIDIPPRLYWQRTEDERDPDNQRDRAMPANMLVYKVGDDIISLFVSETEFIREMQDIIRGAEKTRTVRFPNTMKVTETAAFDGVESLRSVVLNEGLEVLGGHTEGWQPCRVGPFRGTQIGHVALPSTLLALGDCTFYGCSRLTRVIFAKGTRLKEIGW